LLCVGLGCGDGLWVTFFVGVGFGVGDGDEWPGGDGFATGGGGTNGPLTVTSVP
jgi:hypothetical protein